MNLHGLSGSKYAGTVLRPSRRSLHHPALKRRPSGWSRINLRKSPRGVRAVIPCDGRSDPDEERDNPRGDDNERTRSSQPWLIMPVPAENRKVCTYIGDNERTCGASVVLKGMNVQ